jgi:hypothetical protein
VVDPPETRKASNNVTAKILNANHAITLLHAWNIHAMHGTYPARHRDAKQLLDKHSKMLEELSVIFAVAHIPWAIAVRVQIGKRRRKHAEMNGVIGHRINHINAVSVVC